MYMGWINITGYSDKNVMLIFHKNWLRNDLDTMIYKIDSHAFLTWCLNTPIY